MRIVNCNKYLYRLNIRQTYGFEQSTQNDYFRYC